MTGLLNIGSREVQAALVDENQPNQVLCLTRQELSFLPTAIKKVLTDLVRTNRGQPKNFLVFLGPDFYTAQSQILQKKENQPFFCTPKTIEALLATALAVWPKELAAIFGPENKQELLESLVFSPQLNDYPAIQPINSYAQKLSLTHFVSFAASQVLTQIRSAIEAVFSQPLINFYSWSAVLFQTLDYLKLSESHYLLLILGANSSQLALVWHGAPLNFVSLPRGNLWLTQEFSQTFSTPAAETETMFRLFLEDKLVSKNRLAVEAFLANQKQKWFEVFRPALTKVLAGGLLTEKIFLFDDSSVGPIVATWLAQEPVQGLLVNHPGFKVEELNKLPNWPLLAEIIFCAKILGKEK